MKLMETKSDLNYLLSNIEDKLADKKDKFLMKFEKKILEDLQTLVKQNVKSIIEEQKCNVSDIQRCLISNNIIDEKSVKYPFDIIRNIYKFKSMEDDKSEGTKDRMFLTKNSWSVCVWSVELMKWIMNVQICDITQREKQTHVIDSWTILSSDILAIIIRNKIETKILAYKIPTMEDLKDLGTDYLEYSENEWFGSFDIQGRVWMIKNSLLNSEYFYLIIESNDKYVLQVMKLQEKANDKDKLEIIISLNKVSEKQLTSDIMDVWELSNGPFANHLVLLYGRNYEIYSITQNEYKEGAFIKFTKIEGHYGILLPPHFLEYYHRVRMLDEEYLIFIGSSKIEIRTH